MQQEAVKKGMTRSDIISTIASLSKSQGFYSRLYRNFMELNKEDPDKYEEVMQKLEAQQFKDPVDLILYLET